MKGVGTSESLSLRTPTMRSGGGSFRFEDTTEVEIQLARPGAISGKIMNEAGEPIENAEARVQFLFGGAPTFGRSENSLGRDAIPIAPAKTDANGKFVLRGLPEGTTINLAIQGPGYAKHTRFKVPVDTDGLEFRLKREGRIEGNLSYAGTGAPVANAMIALQGIHPTIGWGTASVDANGNYLLKNLPPGTYNVFLYEGPEGWTAVAKELIEVVEGETVSNMNLTLVRGGFITGRVTDKETGKPIANHGINFYDAARPESQAAVHSTETDETGAYRFRAAPGRALVYAFAPTGYMGGQVNKYVDVVEAETVVVDFQFFKGIELVGWVFTEAGEPVAGAKIANADVPDWHSEYGRSNEQGEFTVSGLRPGQHLALKAKHSKLKLRGKVVVEVQPGALLEIHTQQYEQIKVAGRVVNDKGKPMSSMNISLMHWDPHTSGGISTTVAVTDGDGRFRGIELIVGDKYTISASAKGYQEAETEFTATAEMSKIVDLVLLPIAVTDRFFIEGRITDTADEAVPRARVIVTISQRSGLWETRTNDNGDYRLENLPMPVISNQKDAVRLPPIVLEVRIIHPGYAYHMFERLKPNQRHNLVLIKADGYLAGTVVDADGKPITGATVMVDTEEERSFSGYVYIAVTTNALGEFEIKHIKDKVVPIYVSDERNYKIFKDIAVNQRDLVLTLTPTESKN